MPGTVIVFDEYFMQVNWHTDEYKAFVEAAEDHGWSFEHLALSPHTCQAIVRITHVARGGTQVGTWERAVLSVLRRLQFLRGLHHLLLIKGRKLVDITMSSAVGRKKAGPPISRKSCIGAICADCRVEVKERSKKTTNVWVVLLILNKLCLPRSQMGSHLQPN